MMGSSGTCVVILLLCMSAFVAAQSSVQLVPTTTSSPISVTASSSYSSGTGPTNLLYGTGAWNSGNYPPQWVLFDLAATYTLTEVILKVDELPDGPTTFQIWGGESSTTLFLIDSIVGDSTNNEYLYFNSVSGQGWRYIQINTAGSQSWVAWNSVQIFVVSGGGTGTSSTVQLVPTTPSSPVTVTASASKNSSTLPTNILYNTGIWNSGGAAPQWVYFDFGADYYITSIVMTTVDATNADFGISIYGSDDDLGVNEYVYSVQGQAGTDMYVFNPHWTPYYTYALRYLRITTSEAEGVVSWASIKINVANEIVVLTTSPQGGIGTGTGSK